MRVSRGSLGLLSLACALGVGACAKAQPEVRAALSGSLPQLQQEIAQAERGGPLSDARLERLARAVAEREIASAEGAEGAAQLSTLRPCVRELAPALRERSERGDEPAATALLLLFESGRDDGATLVERYKEADSGAFRALAAYGARSRQHAELRRRYFTDPDERVRRGAFDAAVKAPIVEHLADLLEAARLDPSALNRGRAAQAVGRIGSEAAVLGLVDLFSAGDEQEQLAAVDAWAEPRAYAHGGERELAKALSRSGLVSVSAAALLLRSRDSRGAALGVLARAIAEGSDDERRVALWSAPLEEAAIQQALEKAAKSPSPELTPLVLSRLIELPSKAAQARAALEKAAQDKGDVGLEASYALARLGSAPAIARVEQELTSPRSSRRLRAAITLASLGKRQRLAPRLADQSPLVRTSLACRLSEAS
jgi:HEAT repeat protein